MIIVSIIIENFTIKYLIPNRLGGRGDFGRHAFNFD